MFCILFYCLFVPSHSLTQLYFLSLSISEGISYLLFYILCALRTRSEYWLVRIFICTHALSMSAKMNLAQKSCQGFFHLIMVAIINMIDKLLKSPVRGSSCACEHTPFFMEYWPLFELVWVTQLERYNYTTSRFGTAQNARNIRVTTVHSAEASLHHEEVKICEEGTERKPHHLHRIPMKNSPYSWMRTERVRILVYYSGSVRRRIYARSRSTSC